MCYWGHPPAHQLCHHCALVRCLSTTAIEQDLVSNFRSTCPQKTVPVLVFAATTCVVSCATAAHGHLHLVIKQCMTSCVLGSAGEGCLPSVDRLYCLHAVWLLRAAADTSVPLPLCFPHAQVCWVSAVMKTLGLRSLQVGQQCQVGMGLGGACLLA